MIWDQHKKKVTQLRTDITRLLHSSHELSYCLGMYSLSWCCNCSWYYFLRHYSLLHPLLAAPLFKPYIMNIYKCAANPCRMQTNYSPLNIQKRSIYLFLFFCKLESMQVSIFCWKGSGLEAVDNKKWHLKCGFYLSKMNKQLLMKSSTFHCKLTCLEYNADLNDHN